MKYFETTISIKIKGNFKSSDFNGHFMDEVEKIIEEIRKNNPIKISIDGELGKQIEFTEEPDFSINIDKLKVNFK